MTEKTGERSFGFGRNLCDAIAEYAWEVSNVEYRILNRMNLDGGAGFFGFGAGGGGCPSLSRYIAIARPAGATIRLLLPPSVRPAPGYNGFPASASFLPSP